MEHHDPQAAQSAGFMGLGLEVDELKQWGSWAVAAIVALGLLVIARGQLKRAQAGIDAEAKRRQEEEEAARKAAEDEKKRLENRSLSDDELGLRREEMRGGLVAQVANDPDAAAQVVKAWLHE